MTGITMDQRIMGGKPVIAGTRITVEHVLQELASGMTVEDVAREYELDEQQVREAVEFAIACLPRCAQKNPSATGE